MEYVVIFEEGENKYGAYAPDLPGCGVVGDTMAEVQKLIAEAIEFHIEGLQKAGYAVPAPSYSQVTMDPGMLSASIAVQV